MSTGGGGVYWTPPDDCAWAAAGRTRNAKIVRANARSEDKLNYLFRRPAGLADGLALKEPAPHVALDVTRPNFYLGPPPPELPARRFGMARHLSTCRGLMSSGSRPEPGGTSARSPDGRRGRLAREVGALAFRGCFAVWRCFSCSLSQPAAAAATTTAAAVKAAERPATPVR